MNKTIILVTFFLLMQVISQPVFSATKNNLQTQAKAKLELASEKVNINAAGAMEIARVMKGVGMKKAKAIVAYRKSHGEFKSIKQLTAVKGIGDATIAKNQDRLLLN